jgi:hypothetical protein
LFKLECQACRKGFDNQEQAGKGRKIGLSDRRVVLVLLPPPASKIDVSSPKDTGPHNQI